jgi:YVTN family beta-propeller protein
MRRFRWARGVVVLGLAGALVGVVPSGGSAGAGRERCRATAFVTSNPVSTIDVKTRTKHPDDIPIDPFPFGVAFTPDAKTAFVVAARPNPPRVVHGKPESGDIGTVSTIDVKTRTKHPSDIPVDPFPFEVAVTPDGKTAFVPHAGVVSTIDVKTRTKHPDDIPMEGGPAGVAVTPDGKTALVVNRNSNSVWAIDVKTRTKHPTDIPVGSLPWGIAVTPNGKTAFVANMGSGTVSTIDVKTRTKHPTDIPVGSIPNQVAVTPNGKTAFVTNNGSGTVSTIDVKTRTKHPTDIPVGAHPTGVAVTSDGKTAFITNSALVLELAESGNTVSTIDVKTRKKHPSDITVGFLPSRVAITPCRR